MENCPYTVEFFERLEDAKVFANDTIRRRFVLAVYGRYEKGQKRQFAEWLADAISRGVMSEQRAEKMNACVIW